MTGGTRLRAVVLGVLRLLDRVLQVLVRPDPRQLAWISDPDHVGNAYHLFRHAVTTRRDLTHVWLVVDDDVRPRIEAAFAAYGGPERGHRLVVRDRHSLAGYLAFVRSRRSFHTHGVYRWTTSAVGRDCVSLWHGMPIKAIGALNTISPNPHPTFGTLHLATSDFYRYVIAAAFDAPVDDVLLSGLPRCDVLHQPHPLAPDAATVRRALGVPVDGRLVLWLPTYRTPGHGVRDSHGIAGFQTFLDDLTADQWRRVDEECARTGSTVLVKPHPTDPLNDVDHDVARELGLRHVRVIASPDWLALGLELYDVLAVTDGLISDLSSVLIDWLPTPRPVGMVGFDPATYTRDVLVPVSTLQDSRRVHDLADDAMLVAFFDRVASGVPVPEDDDDLSTWLYRPDLTDGCETVLRAVDL